MPARRCRAVAAAAALALAAGFSGCGGDEAVDGSPDPATEPTDRPANPPPGWRTVTNRTAGFTIAVPRDWTARTRRGATLVRSGDSLLALTVAADRSQAGRDTPAEEYARSAFEALPGFRRLRAGEPRALQASPYENARLDGSGTLAARDQRQRITTAAFRRPGRATWTVVAFAAPVDGRTPHATSLRVVLASLRGRRPEL